MRLGEIGGEKQEVKIDLQLASASLASAWSVPRECLLVLRAGIMG